MPQPPKFQPRRRNARNGPLLLPANGRQGDAPAWPLPVKATTDELETWTHLWHTPHAAAWEALGWTLTVARYCRIMVAAAQHDAQPALLGQVIKLEVELGLTPKSFRLMLWQIAPLEDELEEDEPGKVIDIRDRIQAVE